MTTTTAPAEYRAYHLHQGQDRNGYALGRLETATDVIEFLGEEIANMVAVLLFEKHGTATTLAQFEAAFARTFDAALPEFLRRIDRQSPGLGDRVRRHFIAEQDERDAA